MRIQHNIMAMSAYRNYTNNVSAMKKNLEKLSSGYKINRAGDDAAGLAISEKMRAQITGLETAQKNAKDGISLVQTAEGALTEVHDMLNRMVELATMSANGTYDNTTDRAQLQKEMDQLTSEIDRIADSANFNGIKLLNGEMDGSAKLGTLTAVGSAETVADGVQTGGAATKGVYSLDLKDLSLKLGQTTISSAASSTYTTIVTNSTGTQSTVTLTNPAVSGGVQDKTLAAGDIEFTVGGAKFQKNGADIEFADAITDPSKAGEQIAAELDGSTIEIDGITYDVTGADGKLTLTAQTAPTTADELASNFDVSFTTKADGAVEDTNNGHDLSVHVETAPAMAGDNKLAQGKFTLTNDMIQQGSVLKIGETSYVFQVGDDNPITAGTGQTVIKLTKGLSDADALKEAADKLSQQNNKHFHITTNRDGSTIHLTEKAGAVNYKTDWDLHGTDGNEADADWKKVVQSAKIEKNKTADGKEGKALKLQIGDTADTFNQLSVNIQDMHAKSLGIDGASINIKDQDAASIAIKKIKDAINMVSDVRGTLGATQNRLDHTINNLSVMTENIQDAESTIRDVDVAEEMMAYTKNNILIQSAQAMLAQANQVPQGVLQLLQ
ncbi:MAG: flagellin [Oscillospiraceae bacterium]|jgi:flagellin|nr:flagellin [Oscillospiraceae bacterium]